MSLKNKVAIVTGGNSGIGQAIVLELARQGASVVIDYVAHPEATEALEREICKLGNQSLGVEADVSKLADLQKLIDAAVGKFGRLDIMVNNAGIETRTSVLDTTEAQYERVMAINLKSAFFGTQIAARQMIKQGGGGRVINLSTMNDPAKLAQLNAAIPLGRMARPEEIASVVAFLAGAGASYLTATTIFADGGIMQSSVGL